MLKPVEWLLSGFSVDLGIDLGTANTLVFVRDKGIVLDEPSVVAVRKGTSEVLFDGMAVGDAALEYLGRTPPGFQADPADEERRHRRLRDHREDAALLHAKGCGGKKLVKPRLVIAVPWGITMVEKRAVIGSAERAGARRVFLVDEPTAAAIGAGLPVHEPRGSMIVDIGGGTSEVAVISLANVVMAECLRVAGDDFNDAIAQYIRTKYNLLIGEITAERLKIAAGSCDAARRGDPGRDPWPRFAGQPAAARDHHLGSDVREALQEPVRKVIGAIKSVLERTPPELASGPGRHRHHAVWRRLRCCAACRT
jgi:rod shape-determining protein MreB